jgi:SulP family sulfate permease
MRLVRSDMTLPVCILAGFIGFYAVIFVLGIDLEEAGARGLLLGPFASGGFLEGLSASFVLEARWDVILHEGPTILAILLMSFLGLLLNASGLELSLGHDLDFERELKSAGAANMAAGLSGGLVGYHQLGETILSTRLGITDLSGALAIAMAALLTLFFGAAAVIAILGLDLLYEWLVVQRRRLPAGDFLIVILILLTAAAVGFLEALGVGLLAATVFFIVSYAGVDVVRFRTTGATRRSTVERSRSDMARLATLGKATEIIDLGGFIFFGTANRLYETLRETFRGPAPPRHVVFNLARLTGGDTTARLAVTRAADLCRRYGADLVLAGAPADLAWLVEDLPDVRLFPTIDSALVALEDEILAAEGHASDAPEEDLVSWLERMHPGVDVSLFSGKVMLRDGEVLIREGDSSTAIYQLRTGELRAEVASGSGERLVVARFRPGALVGEIAHYARVPRTAAVVAEAPSEVLRIEIDLIPETAEGKALAADLHRRAAGYLAFRLMRMTNMVREAGF